jgi:hypothetical protein
MQERTKAGRAAAVARDVRMRRKRLLSAQQVAHARKLIGQGKAPTMWQNPSTSRGGRFTGLWPLDDWKIVHCKPFVI